MSDSENMIRDLAVLYASLDPLRVSEATALQTLNQATLTLGQSQVDRQNADGAVGSQQAVIAQLESQILELQNQLATGQNNLPLLQSIANTASQVVANNEVSVGEAQGSYSAAQAAVQAKLQEINDLKARIKAEVDDDFPT